MRKPDLGFYEQIIAAAGDVDEILFIDDAFENVEAATAAGLIGVHASPGWTAHNHATNFANLNRQKTTGLYTA